MKKGYKLCPYCREEIREIANKCHFCGKSLEEQQLYANNKILFKKNENNSNSKSGNMGIVVPLILFIGIIVFLVVYGLFGNKIGELNNQINELNLENKRLQDYIIELSEEKEIIENIGDWICKGKGINGKIQGTASCTKSDGSKYDGDVWESDFNGQGKYVTPDGEIQEGYFYYGKIRAGKVTKSNGDSIKGLWTKKDENTSTLELGKIFHKDNGNIELGDFNNGYLSYGMEYTVINQIGAYWVGKFVNGSLNDGYMSFPYGCGKLINGNAEEITRTVTNTVYNGNGIQLSNTNPLGDFYKVGSKYNPYTVNLNIQ